MNFEQAREAEANYLLSLYTPIRQPMVIERAQGCLMWDTEGREYLDLISGGRAVMVLGHCHPKVVAAVCEQAKKLIHTSNDFLTEPQLRLAQLLSELSGGMKAFFCNSGAEANEAAIKLARKHAFLKYGEQKHEIITALKSFHGRTYAAMTATGQPKYQQGFRPVVPGFNYVAFNDLAALEQAVSDKTAAVMLEPILGESGAYPATQEFLQGAAALCRRHNALLILDEVQTGMGRTGKFFAFEHYGVAPEVVTLSKGIAGGVPFGAMLAREPAASSFTFPDHATTFGGSALPAAAALAAITALREEGLIENARKMGEYLKSKLCKLQESQPVIADVRGKGLMVGVEFNQPIAAAVKKLCAAEGVLINSVGDLILRLLPATVINADQIDRGVEVLGNAISQAGEGAKK